MKKLFRFIPIVMLFAACAVFFYPTFAKGLLPVPTDTLIGLYHPWLDQAATTNPAGVPFKNFLITDPIRQQIPWRKLVIDDWKNGIVPSWNPYNFSGTSLGANIQAAPWYPFNILFFLLPFMTAWTALIIIQPLLASWFMYLYLRSKKVIPTIAVFGGMAWAFCGFTIAWLTWGTIVQTALWLPLILLAINKIFESNSHRTLWAMALAGASTVAFFAGHAQVALYIFVLAGMYTLFALWHAQERKRVYLLVAAAVVTVAISSLQWVPFLQLISRSARISDMTAWLKDGWFLPWQNLMQFIAPDFFGNPATLNYWGIWNYGEFIGYIGILPLILFIYAVIVRKDRLTRFFEVSLLLALAFMLPTPLAKLPFQFKVPILFTLQPTRLMVLVDFSLVILAALGLDSYVKNPSKKIFVSVICIGVVLAGLWMYVFRTSHLTQDTTLITNLAVSRRNLALPTVVWLLSSVALLIPLFLKKRWTNAVVFLLICITAFDLFRFGWKFTPFSPTDYFFPTTSAISFLQSQPKPFRVMSLDNRILPPNVGAYYGIESIEGYDPIYDSRYEEFIAAMNRNAPNIAPPFGFNRIITSPTIDSPLLRLLNVAYVLTLEDVNNPDLQLVYQEGSTRVYRYKKALPRIYPVQAVMLARTSQEAITDLYAKSFDPMKTAVIEDAKLLGSEEPLMPQDTVKLVSYSDTYLSFQIGFSANHIVVVSNMFDPHWKVAVDGKAVPIYRVDYLFIGFQIYKGEHLVTVTYE